MNTLSHPKRYLHQRGPRRYKSKNVPPERFLAQCAVIRAKLRTALLRQREKNLSTKRLQSTHGTSRKIRQERRARMHELKGTVTGMGTPGRVEA